MLRNSSRFRATFTEEQRSGVYSTLSHLGWAPQRMSSRANVYRRIAGVHLTDMLSALARECEGGAMKKEALHNLRSMAPFRRFMLAGLLADLTVEHQKAVRETDTADPDPCLVSQQLARFRLRCRVLFTEGQVYVIKETFTSNILRFYKDPSAIFVGKEALLFAMPQERAAYFEPLERIRAIVGNVLACLEAALPEQCWITPPIHPLSH